MTIQRLIDRYSGRQLRGCPGRYVLTDAPPGLTVEALVGSEGGLREFDVPAARDTVVVAVLAAGGVISYRRKDGTYLHTVNTPEGFERKLAALGIHLF